MDRIIDLTAEQPDPPKLPKQKHRIVGGKVVKRDPKTITGIVIHQTACIFGVSDAAVKAANGDRALAKHRRALGVACHVLAFTTGKAVYANPLDWYVWHGNAFNTYSLGLEVEGLYPGLYGGKTWGSQPKTELVEETVKAACAALDFMVTKAKALGMPLRYIWAHRQASKTRRDDPGEELWKLVVAGYAVPKLGLEAQPELIIGDGRAIPPQWDFHGIGSY